MARFDERPLQLTDILGRFESDSHQTHIRNALGLIGRLKDHGREFWDEDSDQFLRWNKGCTELWRHLNRLGARRDIEKQDLATAMREFIQEFEHTTWRMYQMLYGALAESNDDKSITKIFDWINLVFRASVYALVSGWVGDKQENSRLDITVNMVSGETKEEWTRDEMKVPAKYRRAAKKV